MSRINLEEKELNSVKRASLLAWLLEVSANPWGSLSLLYPPNLKPRADQLLWRQDELIALHHCEARQFVNEDPSDVVDPVWGQTTPRWEMSGALRALNLHHVSLDIGCGAGDEMLYLLKPKELFAPNKALAKNWAGWRRWLEEASMEEVAEQCWPGIDTRLWSGIPRLPQ